MNDYHYWSAESTYPADYLHRPLLAICRQFRPRRILDIGCGNGFFTGELAKAGFDVVGCDPSEQGIEFARKAHPGVSFHRLGVEDDPVRIPGTFDLIVSLEVIEHLHRPRLLPRFAGKLLEPDGRLVITTPYHGYLKNLALSLLDKWDAHHYSLWDDGHVKFFSYRTLSALLAEEGFTVEQFVGAGRARWLWKSMIVVAAAKPSSSPAA